MSLWARNVSGLHHGYASGRRLSTNARPPRRSRRPQRAPAGTITGNLTPHTGTRGLRLFLYADVYTAGASPPTSTPIWWSGASGPSPARGCGEPRRHQRQAPALYTVDGSFSPEWIGPPGEPRVEVDGLRNGWLSPSPGNDSAALRPVVVVPDFALWVASRGWCPTRARALPMARRSAPTGRGGTTQPEKTDTRMSSEVPSLQTRLGRANWASRQVSSPTFCLG